MGFLTQIARLGAFGRGEAKSADPQDWMTPELMSAMMRPSSTGIVITPERALESTAFYRAAVLIAQSIAQLPCEVYHPHDGEGSGIVPYKDHPAYYLLRYKASELQSAYQFIQTMLLHAVTTGNAVAYKNYVGRTNGIGGELKEIIPLVPGTYSIETSMRSWRRFYNVSFPDGQSATLESRDVVHIMGPSWDVYRGLNTSKKGQEAIALALATEKTHAEFHRNSARPSGFLSSKQTGLSEAEVKRIKTMWEEVAAGLDNVGKIPFVTGEVSFEQLRMSGVDSEHVSTRKLQTEEIGRLTGVTPMLLGQDAAQSLAGARAILNTFVKFTAQPWIREVTDSLTISLLTRAEIESGVEIRIDTSELMRGSPEERAAYYEKALGNSQQPGWLSSNEVRQDDGWNPVPGGDEIMKPTPAMANKDPAAQVSPRSQQPQQTGNEEKSSRPRSLYVRRNLVNTEAIVKWARSQGLDPQTDMHVTIMYSRTLVDWMAMGATWEGEIVVPPGGPRVIERMGDGGAVALLFRNNDLEWRHAHMREMGAVHSYPEYQPHLTITWNLPPGVDLDKVDVYQGEIRFGPEIFGEIRE